MVGTSKFKCFTAPIIKKILYWNTVTLYFVVAWEKQLPGLHKRITYKQS